MSDDVLFDVSVSVKPLWKRPATSVSEEMTRRQTETRFAMLADEIRKMVLVRLKNMQREQGDDIHLWVGLLAPVSQEPDR
jgi:hypothetical protein